MFSLSNLCIDTRLQQVLQIALLQSVIVEFQQIIQMICLTGPRVKQKLLHSIIFISKS